MNGDGASLNDGGMNGPMPMQQMAAPTLAVPGRIRSAMGKTYTKRYKGPMAGISHAAILNYNEPLFYRYWIPAMMRDPHLWYGIQMLRGPIISKAKFELVCDDAGLQEYGQRQLDNFLIKGLPISLDSMVWGYNGSEILYEYNEEEECMEFAGLRYLHPADVRPVLQDGCLVGMVVKRVDDPPSWRAGVNRANGLRDAGLMGASSKNPASYRGEYDHRTDGSANSYDNDLGGKYVGLPKALWTVHDQTANRWYGRSRLAGAFIPWYETWQPQGYRNIRHLWMYKNAFDSGVVKYPEGSTQDADGNKVPNVLLAEEMLDRKETGGGFALPNNYGDKEGGGWDWIPPTGIAVPDGLFDYGDSLRDEKWEGIGVPPEVAGDEDGGGSFSGRRVPQQAFYSFLQEIANENVFGFKEQSLQFLMNLRAGRRVRFEIKPISILLTLQQEEMGQVTGHLPGDENDDFYGGDEEGMDEGMDEEGGEFQENELSNGRIEDRSTNGFNKAEKSMAKGAKSKGKKPFGKK